MNTKPYKERLAKALDSMPHMTEEEFYLQMSRSMGTPIKYIRMIKDIKMEELERDRIRWAEEFQKANTPVKKQISDSQSCPECDALASYGSNDGPCEAHKI